MTRATPPLVADWIDLDQWATDPYPGYTRLRAESPVAYVPALGRYLVTSYSGCHLVEADQDTFTADVAAATMTRAMGARPMLRKDDPDHAVERKPINPVLRPRAIQETWQSIFARNTGYYLDALAARGPADADLNHDYAAPLAAQNLIDMLGLPDVAVHDMRRWSHALIAGIGNVLDNAEIWQRSDDAQAEIDALLVDLVPHYRAHPNPSLTSALANSGLADENVAANVKLVISGGMNEPQHMITAMVWALDGHPEQRARALKDATLWPAVFDEAARWQSPIGMYPRQTTRTVQLEGVELPAGAQLGVVVSSANRDEAQFGDDAQAFDLHRAKKPHLAFGAGAHQCAGHWAAKTSVGRIAVPRLFARFPGLRVDTSRTTNWQGWVFRGLTDLPVTWDR